MADHVEGVAEALGEEKTPPDHVAGVAEALGEEEALPDTGWRRREEGAAAVHVEGVAEALGEEIAPPDHAVEAEAPPRRSRGGQPQQPTGLWRGP